MFGWEKVRDDGKHARTRITTKLGYDASRPHHDNVEMARRVSGFVPNRVITTVSMGLMHPRR